MLAEADSEVSNSLENEFVCETEEEEISVKISRPHPRDLLTSLLQLRCNGDFCDVEIKCQNVVVKAHKIILSSATEYFKAMFLNETKESESGIVNFSEMSPEVVKQCLEFIYSGKIEISMKTAKDLLDASEMMQLSNLSSLCLEFLAETVNLQTCAELISLSALYNKDSLDKSLKEFIKGNFRELSQSKDLLSLDYNAVLYFLNLLERNDENCEIQKWHSITAWTNANLEERKTHIHGLFKTLNLKCVPRYFLKKTISRSDLVDNSHECLRLIRDALIDDKNDCQPASQLTHIVAVNNLDRNVAGCAVACTDILSTTMPVTLNCDMNVVHHQGNLYVGTGIRIYQFSNKKWTNVDVDFNKVMRNPTVVTCSSCHKDHWLVGRKERTYEIKRIYDDEVWSTEQPGINQLDAINRNCRYCNKSLNTTNVSTSCYNRCFGIRDSVYMITRNYLIQYNIETSEVIHHSVLVGLGNRFSATASDDCIYAVGGNGTQSRAVVFDLKSCKLIHLPHPGSDFSFGSAVFRDNKLLVTDSERKISKCYDSETRNWKDSSLKIPRTHDVVHLGTDMLMNMFLNSPSRPGPDRAYLGTGASHVPVAAPTSGASHVVSSPFGGSRTGASSLAAPLFGTSSVPLSSSPFGGSRTGASSLAASRFGTSSVPLSSSPFGTSSVPLSSSPFGGSRNRASSLAASPFGTSSVPLSPSPFRGNRTGIFGASKRFKFP